MLASTRWLLRKAVKAVNEVLGSLRMEKHPDKTFIGRIEKGFDFLGTHFSPAGLTVAKTTFVRFVARATRLYEQEPGEALASTRLGLYARRWVRWAGAGLGAARGNNPNTPPLLSPVRQFWGRDRLNNRVTRRGLSFQLDEKTRIHTWCHHGASDGC